MAATTTTVTTIDHSLGADPTMMTIGASPTTMATMGIAPITSPTTMATMGIAPITFPTTMATMGIAPITSPTTTAIMEIAPISIEIITTTTMETTEDTLTPIQTTEVAPASVTITEDDLETEIISNKGPSLEITTEAKDHGTTPIEEEALIIETEAKTVEINGMTLRTEVDPRTGIDLSPEMDKDHFLETEIEVNLETIQETDHSPEAKTRHLVLLA